MHGRLLDCTLGDPYSNVALEEALFRVLKAPVLRVWENQKCVVIGRGQLAWAETDLSYCRENSIPVVRRFTAGGAVYNGPGNLNWSFLVPRGQKDWVAGKVFDAKGVFEAFADIVTKALAACSAGCAYDPPNRIVSRDGKVSGMAAYISSEGVICHGTLLIDADLDEVERLTSPQRKDVGRRYPRSRVAKVANCHVDRAELTRQLVAASGVVYEPDSLDGEERALTSKLVDEKYSTSEWNEGDPFSPR